MWGEKSALGLKGIMSDTVLCDVSGHRENFKLKSDVLELGVQKMSL